MALKRLKVLNGYTAHARFLDETPMKPAGFSPRHDDLPSPYAYSPTETVHRWRGKLVIIKETRQRHYEVFEVPADQVYRRETDAENAYLNA